MNVGRYAEGGLVGGMNSSRETAPLGGSPANVSNSFTINVTIENDGAVTGGEVNSDQNMQSSMEEDERQKEMGVVIKDAITRELVLQKRPGGLLYNERRGGI